MLLALGLLAACGNKSTEPIKEESPVEDSVENKEETAVEAAFPVTIKDAADKDIVIEKKPEKIVSLMPSNTEILFALGEGETVIGVSESDSYPEEVAEIDKVAGWELNVEEILALDPDLVLAHGSTMLMWEPGFQQLQDSGLTVLFVHDAQSFEEVYATIELVGNATGKTDEAKEIVSNMKAKLEELKEKAAEISADDEKSVYVEVSPEPDLRCR